MEKNKALTYKDILNEKAKFVAFGTITDISGESNKVYNSGWVGSNAELTIMVDGRKQKVKVFGGVGKNEFAVKVFTKGSDGKAVRDGNNKAIQTEIFATNYNPNVHMTFDKREVIEWGERDSEGKAKKIEIISELTDGRFADKLISKKSELIGKRVKVSGDISFKPTQKYDKLEANMSVKQIVIQQVVEGKEVQDRFLIETPTIIEKKTIVNTVKDEFIGCFVPVYHKFEKPQMTDGGRELKGRNVFVPINFTVNMNGFLGLPAEGYFDLQTRANILTGKINNCSDGFDLAIAKTVLNYKSGMIERDITIEELLQDPVYATMANQAMSATEEEKRDAEIEKLLHAYKLINPMTVKGEFKQQIDFVSVIQQRTGTDHVAPIEQSHFEIMTLQKIGEELEDRKTNTPQQQTSTPKPAPYVQSKNTSHVAEPTTVSPIMSIDDFDEDSFPF